MECGGGSRGRVQGVSTLSEITSGFLIDHFTVSLPLSGCEAGVDLVLRQTFFSFSYGIMLKNTWPALETMIYITKQRALYENKANSSFVLTITVEWAINTVQSASQLYKICCIV